MQSALRVVWLLLLSFTGCRAQAGPNVATSAPALADAARLDPVGQYDLTFLSPLGNPNAPGRLRIAGTPGHYEGTFGPDGAQPATILSVETAGAELTISVQTGTAGIGTVSLVVRGDSVFGKFTFAANVILLAGSRAVR